MNPMKSFYAAISSVPGPQSPYLGALAKITLANRKQTRALMSDMGWQEWGEQKQETATA